MPSSDTTIMGSQAALTQFGGAGRKIGKKQREKNPEPFGKSLGADIQAVNVVEASECLCLQL